MARTVIFATDETTGLPVVGATVRIYAQDGGMPALTDDSGQVVPQPVITQAIGVAVNVPDPGNIYTVEYRYGGRLLRQDQEIIGSPPQFTGPPGSDATINKTNLGNLMSTLPDIANGDALPEPGQPYLNAGVLSIA